MDKQGRGKSGRFERTPEQAENDSKAVRLRAQGASYPAIARALGYSDAGGAYKAVQRALAAVPEPAVGELRALQGEELDQLQREAWKIIATPHLKVSNSGRVAVHPETGEPLLDTAPAVAAINALVRIGDRRAKLYGLDMPARAHLEIDMISPETAWAVIEANIARMEAEIAAEERRQGLPPRRPEHPG